MGSTHRASDCKAYSMPRFRPISATVVLLLVLVEVISGSSQPKEIEGLSLSPRDSSGYRWVRRVVMSRDTLSAATTLCAEERGQGVGDVIGIFMLKLPPDLTLGSCSDSQSP